MTPPPTYRMVSREEVDELEKQLGDRIVGPWFSLVRALLAEREAAIKVAAHWKYQYREISRGRMADDYTDQVKQEITNLLSRLGGEGES